MKRFLIATGLTLTLLGSLTGCKDELEDKYFNPEKSDQASLPGFLTGIINNNRVRPSYWNVRTFLLQQPAVYSQTAFFSNSNSAYQHNDSYIGQYWQDFYGASDNGSGALGMYRAMEVAYSNLSVEDKASQLVLMEAAKVILYDQASQMVDLWGDIPYSEAGSLQTSSTLKNPKFDPQMDLYMGFLDSLKESATYFGTATGNNVFTKSDILLRGSTDRWRRYANSLRLRLLMRVSNVNEAMAKAEIMEMLNNPAQYPLIDGGNTGNYSPATADIILPRLTNNNDNLNSGLTELPSHYAPDYMLNTVMNPANDPRIPVMFDKFGKTVKVNDKNVFVPNTTYKAMPITWNSTEQTAKAPEHSILDSATFLQNPALPGIIITSSEVNFIKAEAYERWGNTADAQIAYETAVKQSVTFYYYLNSLNTTGLKVLSKPEESVINEFVTNSTIAYAGSTEQKQELIGTQKWLHFGFLQSTQAWSEYRRTDYPKLTFPAASQSGFETPPTRLVYPSVETTFNSASYAKVKANDLRTAKIFWDVK